MGGRSCADQDDSVTAVIRFTGTAISQYSTPGMRFCKARRAVSPVIPEVSTRTASSTIVLSATSYAGTATPYDPPVLKLRSVLYSGRPPTLPVLILLPRFADKNFSPVSVGGDSAISIIPGSGPNVRLKQEVSKHEENMHTLTDNGQLQSYFVRDNTRLSSKGSTELGLV